MVFFELTSWILVFSYSIDCCNSLKSSFQGLSTDKNTGGQNYTGGLVFGFFCVTPNPIRILVYSIFFDFYCVAPRIKAGYLMATTGGSEELWDTHFSECFMLSEIVVTGNFSIRLKTAFVRSSVRH